jgi:hypothetical protein
MSASNQLPMRLGASALGLLVGLIPGFALAITSLAMSFLPDIPFAAWVFGTAGTCAAVGFLFPNIAFASLPALGQFFAGVGAGITVNPNESELQPERSIPSWLRTFFFLGVVIGVISAVALVLR